MAAPGAAIGSGFGFLIRTNHLDTVNETSAENSEPNASQAVSRDHSLDMSESSRPPGPRRQESVIFQKDISKLDTSLEAYGGFIDRAVEMLRNLSPDLTQGSMVVDGSLVQNLEAQLDQSKMQLLMMKDNMASTLEKSANAMYKKVLLVQQIQAFHHWARYLGTSHCLLVERGYERMRTHRLGLFWRRWVSKVLERRRQRKRARFIHLAHEGRAFWSWVKATQSLKQRERVRSSMLRMSRRRSTDVMTSWIAKAEQRKQTRSILAVSMRRPKQRRMLHAVSKWIFFVAESRRKLKLVSRMLIRTSNSAKTKALLAWKATVSSRRYVRRIFMSLSVRRRHSYLSSFCQDWKLCKDYRKYTRNMHYLIRTRVATRMKKEGFTDMIDGVHHFRAQKATMRRFLLHHKQSLCARALCTWRHRSDVLTARRKQMQRVARYLTNRMRGKAFQQWYSTILGFKRSIATFETVVARIRFRRVYAVLNKWWSWKCEILYRRHAVDVIARFKRRAGMVSGVKSWRRLVEEKRSQRQKTLRIVKSFNSRRLSIALEHMQQLSQNAKVLRTRQNSLKNRINRRVSQEFFTGMLMNRSQQAWVLFGHKKLCRYAFRMWRLAGPQRKRLAAIWMRVGRLQLKKALWHWRYRVCFETMYRSRERARSLEERLLSMAPVIREAVEHAESSLENSFLLGMESGIVPGRMMKNKSVRLFAAIYADSKRKTMRFIIRGWRHAIDDIKKNRIRNLIEEELTSELEVMASKYQKLENKVASVTDDVLREEISQTVDSITQEYRIQRAKWKSEGTIAMQRFEIANKSLDWENHKLQDETRYLKTKLILAESASPPKERRGPARRAGDLTFRASPFQGNPSLLSSKFR